MFNKIANFSLLLLFIIPAFAFAGTVQLPQTGQTTCYDTAGAVIDCAGPGKGQDGDLRAGVPWPEPRFTVSGDCVTDNLTGLMWTKNGDMPGGTRTWQGALDYVAILNSGGGLCGHSDWRLPNVNELESLVNAKQANPAVWLNGQGFTNVRGSFYWSSSTYVYNSVYGKYSAWIVGMGGGAVTDLPKSESGLYVWPVRAGQSGPLDHFAVTAPVSATAGAPFSFTVTALDQFGNTATGYAGTVHFTSSDVAAVLPADATLTNGVGTFSATLETEGTRTITAADTVTASITGTSGNIAVSAAPATHFTVTAPASATSGAAFNYTVTALDQFNKTATGYTGTVHFTGNDAAAALPADATLTNGVGTFSATLKTSGNQTITATDTVTATITGSSGNVTVIPAVATHFAVSAPASATAGTAFNFTVTALDQSNKTATGYAGTVHFTGSDGAATLPADSTLTNGVGTFSATLKTSGTRTITATDTVTVSITGNSGNIAVSAAPATHFAVSAPASATSGTAFNYTVTALDQSNNTATGYAGTVHFTGSDGAAVLPADATLTNGVGTFSATLETAGTRTITATDTVTASITGSSNVDVINVQTATGDINGDGDVTIGDALLALRVAVGLVAMDNKYLTNGDVAPFANGKPAPDGNIEISDALIILRKSVGLINW